MCIAILNTKSTLDLNVFKNSWDNNPHGAGMAYIEENKIKIVKEMELPDRLYHIYSNIREKNTLPIIIHFRIATSGKIDEENCHPFKVTRNLVMAHNGIIQNVTPTKECCDTRVFISQILNGLPEHFLFNPSIERLISGFIEDSKLIFLNSKGIYSIINEHLGHWDANQINWYSNYSYQDYHRPRNTPYEIMESYDICHGCDQWMEEQNLTFNQYLHMQLCNECLYMLKQERVI